MDNTLSGILAVLVVLAIGIAWVLIELRKLNDAIAPIAESNIVQGLARI